jgi:hypothetical protein
MTEQLKITGTTCKYDGNDLRNVELVVELPLRDLFAAFALAGIAGNASVSSADTGRWAYERADAAIAAREGME